MRFGLLGKNKKQTQKIMRCWNFYAREFVAIVSKEFLVRYLSVLLREYPEWTKHIHYHFPVHVVSIIVKIFAVDMEIHKTQGWHPIKSRGLTISIDASCQRLELLMRDWQSQRIILFIYPLKDINNHACKAKPPLIFQWKSAVIKTTDMLFFFCKRSDHDSWMIFLFKGTLK